MEAEKTHPRERRERKQTEKGGKELKRTRFPLDDFLSPCSCLNEILKCVSSEVNLPLTAPTQHTSLDLHLKKKENEEGKHKFDHFTASTHEEKQRLQCCPAWIQVVDIVNL